MGKCIFCSVNKFLDMTLSQFLAVSRSNAINVAFLLPYMTISSIFSVVIQAKNQLGFLSKTRDAAVQILDQSCSSAAAGAAF